MTPKARFLCALIVIIHSASAVFAVEINHERLRMANTFQSPKEVVQYYCSRDAQGFVWSGLLDLERSAFTLWKSVPQFETFYIARKYDVGQPERIGHDNNHVQIEVKYDLIGSGDMNGARAPASQKNYSVVFELMRIGGVWKIQSPEPGSLPPVLLESQVKAGQKE